MSVRIIRLLALAAALMLSASVYAQSFEDMKEQMQRDYGDQKSQMHKQYREYREKLNEEFARCLGRPWEAVERTEPKEEPLKMVVPDEPQPVCKDPEVVREGFEVTLAEAKIYNVEDACLPQPQPVAPVFFQERTDQVSLFVNYFNSACSIRFNPSKKVRLTDTSEPSVMEMWHSLSEIDYDNVISDCLDIRDRLSLCDWGFLKLTETVSKVIYDDVAESDCAVVLQAYLMNQSGYKIRLGRDDSETLHLLVATVDDIIGKSYWNFSGSHYYIADDSLVDVLYMVQASFPGEKSIRLMIEKSQNLEHLPSPRREFQSEKYEDAKSGASLNENQMAFWAEYPTPYRDASPQLGWYYYANTPISDPVKEQLYPSLQASIEGKTQLEAVNILLNFVQTAFQYAVDADVWGDERFFFPEETLFYPYSDCEDRAILFSRMVRDLLGLEVMLVYYPNHLSTAVCIEEECYGDKLIYKGKKYTICDPTFINAEAGRTMDGCDNNEAEIILL